MAKDRRKKGCPNPECKYNTKKKKFDSDVNFCPNCGAPLVLVCAKCFGPLEDKGPSHTLCGFCEAVEQKKIEKLAGKVVDAADQAKDKAGIALKVTGNGLAIGADAALTFGKGVVEKIRENEELKEAAEKVKDKAIREAGKLAEEKVGDIADAAKKKRKV